jgi:hypothetical protein
MNRTLLKCAATVAVTIGLAAAPAALAHHSFAMFDFSKSEKLKGVIKEFQWTNPHVIVWVVASPQPGQAGAEEVWSLELTSPGNLTRGGWTRHSLKPGDRVEVEFAPLRDGQHGGAFTRAVLSDTGEVLSANLREQTPNLR